MLWSFAVSGAMAFVYIALKALQQINVVTGRYALVMPLSLGMGVCEVAIVLLAVKTNSIALGVTNGFCAGCGALAAMHLNRKIYK